MTDDAPSRFLQRWSERKRRTQAETSTVPIESLPASIDAAPEPLPVVQGEALSENLIHDTHVAPARELTDADMPALESLDEHSDYSGFLSRGVSRELRALALRKLFAGAGFQVRDGLDDYDEDFTQFEPLGDIVTSDMKYQQRLQAEREAQEKDAHQDIDAETDAERDVEPEATVAETVEGASDPDVTPEFEEPARAASPDGSHTDPSLPLERPLPDHR